MKGKLGEIAECGFRIADWGSGEGITVRQARRRRITLNAQWPNKAVGLQVERGDGAGAGVAVCGVWLVRACLVCWANQQGEPWTLRSVNRCRGTLWSAESAKRQASGSVAGSGLAVWQTPRTIEMSGNQRRDPRCNRDLRREGVLCFGSLGPRRFGKTLPDCRVSEIRSCKSSFRPFRAWFL